MKNRIGKKICISLFVMIIMVVFIYTKSYAKELNSITELISERNIGNSIQLSRDGTQTGDKTSLMWNKYLYCFQHEKRCEEAVYKVQAYVEIDGDKATRYFDDHTKEIDNDANLGLAYILQHGDFNKGYYTGGRQTLRQRALWKYGNTWIDGVGSNLGMSWDVWRWKKT